MRAGVSASLYRRAAKGAHCRARPRRRSTEIFKSRGQIKSWNLFRQSKCSHELQLMLLRAWSAGTCGQIRRTRAICREQPLDGGWESSKCLAQSLTYQKCALCMSCVLEMSNSPHFLSDQNAQLCRCFLPADGQSSVFRRTRSCGDNIWLSSSSTLFITIWYIM